ncbi:MAG: ABC transporter permease [Pseudomonadota bacterium]
MTASEIDVSRVADPEERARLRARRVAKIASWTLPVLVAVGMIGLWHWYVVTFEVPHYLLPPPSDVIDELIKEWGSLSVSWGITARVAAYALLLAVVGGVVLGVLFSLSRYVEMSIYPYAVILQVTPVISIAPLIIIYIDDPFTAQLFCAWIVAFFPILSSTTVGLASADHNLRDLMTIYGASRWQQLRYLKLPGALPYFLNGLRIAGGLSLIGAVVAEFAIGAGGRASGLAMRISEAGFRLQTDRLFAALLLIMVTGIFVYLATSLLTHLLLRKWHESAVRREA